MCYRVECRSCGKYTWGGCGRHLRGLYENIHEGRHCMCRSWPGVVIPFSHPSTTVTHQPSTNVEDGVVAQRDKSRMKGVEDYFRFDNERDKPGAVRNVLLTIAILMATATYQAALCPPGGVWQDDNPNTNPKQVAGVSILGTKNHLAFAWFMVGNALGFYSSLYMIALLTRGLPLRLELTFAMVAIGVTYSSSMSTIAPSRHLSVVFTVLSIVLPLSLPIIIPCLRILLGNSGRSAS